MANAPEEETRSSAALLLLLVPALGFPGALAAVGFGPGVWPWQVWGMGSFGLIATTGGVLDWVHHRAGHRRIPRREALCERAALGCGVVVFALMTLATFSVAPGRFLAPVVALVIATTVLICVDELRFHRACSAYETRLHRALVLGNGAALLCWMDWCFVGGTGLG